MPSLYVETNDGKIFSSPIKKNKIRIGRSKDNDVTLFDTTVSRHHVEISKTSKGYVITDLGSFNGTKVNGKSIQNTILNYGDTIGIGLNKVIFKEKEGQSIKNASDSFILGSGSEHDKSVQKIVEKISLKGHGDSRSLLVSVEEDGLSKKGKKAKPSKEDLRSKSYLSKLARNNKVLFVLYEISRQLNQFQDFNELLRKIMDLIFMVIDADYGFLVLLGGEKGNELIPLVVKHKNGSEQTEQEVKASRTLINKVIQNQVALLTADAMSDPNLDPSKSIMKLKIKSAMCVPLWKKDKIIGVIELDNIRFNKQFTQNDLELLKAIGSQVAMVIEQSSLNKKIKIEERMRSRLERFHSPQVIEMILKGTQETKDNIMDPKELTATILFTDIVNFSNLAEQMPPRETTIILNRYFSQMTDIVFDYDGTLDKYIGDGLMAVFGAPMEKQDDPERAIKTALEMKKQLAVLMDSTLEERKFDIRIGINTGRVVAGNIGSPKRMEYTVIGDPVNVASRLESIAHPNQILIGEETYESVRGKFDIQEVGPKKVKGKKTEVMAYEVLG